MPYVTETIHREMDFDKILSMVKTRIELFTEIPGHIDFFEAVPEYDVEMYKHKKMKTTPETSLTVLKRDLSSDRSTGRFLQMMHYMRC